MIENPYTAKRTNCPGFICSNTQICGGGLTNVTGTNLTGIMETMKFAYQLAVFNDYVKLQERIVRTNFTYTLAFQNDVIL